MNPDYSQAIKDIESSGGDYGALGPVMGNGDRAYGAYQVMGNNVPDWTEKHFGQRMSPEEFLKNKDAQDAVFKGQFGSYVGKYGNPQDAASAWFSGRPLAHNTSTDGSTSVPEYVAAFNKALGVKNPSGTGALSFAKEDDEDEDTPTAALSAANTVGPGALQRVMKGGEDDNKLNTIGQGLAGIGASLAGISSPQQAYALSAQAAQMKKDNTSKYKVTVAKDGRIIRVDDSGNVDTIGGNPAGSAPQLPGDPTKEGAEYFKTLDPVTQNIIQSWHEGTGVAPTSYQMRNPAVMSQIAAAQKAFPDMDFTKLGERKTFATDYAKTSPTSIGGQSTAALAGMKHMNNIADNYLDLKNGNGGGWTQAAHMQNAWRDQTDGTGRSALANALNNNGALASGEITKAITGNGGGVHERAERAQRLANSQYAPIEAADVLESERKALSDKHDNFVEKARTAMGQSWVDRHPELEQSYRDEDAKLSDKIAQLRQRANGTDKKGSTTASPLKPNTTYDWHHQNGFTEVK